jgi:hypothetical protein
MTSLQGWATREIGNTSPRSTPPTTHTYIFYLLMLLLLSAFSAALSWKSFTSHRGPSPTSAPNHSIYVYQRQYHR